MKRPSIRARLVLWAALLTTSILLIGGYLLYFSVRSSLYSQLDRILENAASVVIIEVEVKDSKVYHEWREALEEDPYQKAHTLIQVWDQKSGESVRSPALQDHDLPKKHGELGERVFFDLTLPDGTRGRAVGILIHPVLEHPERDPDFVPAKHPQIFVWAQSTKNLQDILIHTRTTFFIGGLVIIILLWIVIWKITSYSLKPMEIVSKDILARPGSEVGKPIPIPPTLPSEVAGMAETFNTLLERIDQSRSKDRDFFLNVAHEIRTPLAGLHSSLEQALRRERSLEDYQHRINEALDSSRELQLLIESLMRFGRITRQVDQPVINEHRLLDLLNVIWLPLKTRAAEKDLTLAFKNIDENSTLTTDERLARIAISNLLENAISYASPSSAITITQQSPHQVVIENKIDEHTIPPESLSRFFDPFYRRDQARSDAKGHAGIGLGFTKEIMVILGGSIQAKQSKAHSISFILNFPI